MDEAIYPGVLPDEPEIGRIQIERPCTDCGSPIEVRVMSGSITSYCTSCPSVFGETNAFGSGEPAERGYLGKMSLPPAGFDGRSPVEIYRAAQVGSHLELLPVSNGVCPRCTARVDHEVLVCEDHEATGELSTACGNRQPMTLDIRYTN